MGLGVPSCRSRGVQEVLLVSVYVCVPCPASMPWFCMQHTGMQSCWHRCFAASGFCKERAH